MESRQLACGQAALRVTRQLARSTNLETLRYSVFDNTAAWAFVISGVPVEFSAFARFPAGVCDRPNQRAGEPERGWKPRTNHFMH